MIDFGLICMFALQLFAVIAVVFVWNRITSEVTAVKRIKDDFVRSEAATANALTSQTKTIEAVELRMGKVEDMPTAARKRLEEAESKIAVLRGDLSSLESKHASTAARVSINARWEKKKAAEAEEEGETAPASEEESPIPTHLGGLPGAIRLNVGDAAPQPPNRSNFGVTRRKHG